MLNHRSHPLRLALALAIGLTGCQQLGGFSFRDKVAVNNEQTLAALPTKAPNAVYVANFKLDASHFQGDQGLRGAVPTGGLLNSVAGEVGNRLPQPLVTSDPAAKADEIVNIMADELVSDLKDKGVPAQRLPAGALPRDGWLISGEFTDVEEGNRLKRAALGFGQGSSEMTVSVALSDLSSAQPTQPFALFGTVKEAGKKPGAAVTLNPYVAAAKFVMERNASEKDTRKTADEIVTELLKFRDQVRQARATQAAGH